MNVKFSVTAFLLFVLLLSACASPATPTAEVASIPSEVESGVSKNEAGLYPLSTRTGIADIDAVIAAVESGDPQQVRDLFQFISVACTNADGLGGPPKCREGEAEETLVDVLPFLGSEGSFLHKENISNFPGVNVVGVYAAYKVSRRLIPKRHTRQGSMRSCLKEQRIRRILSFKSAAGSSALTMCFRRHHWTRSYNATHRK